MTTPACIIRNINGNIAYSVIDTVEIPNKWRKNPITYSITRGTKDIPDEALERKIINLGVLMWEEEINIQIKPVKVTQSPDIKLSFMSSSEDQYFASDSSILAWSGYPETGYQGIMHFNDDYRWSKDGKPISAHLADPTHYPDPKDPTTFATYNLNQTFRHEFGHTLGEVHIETCPLCIMYPIYNQTLELQPIEIARIVAKYGVMSKPTSLYNRLKAWMKIRVRNE